MIDLQCFTCWVRATFYNTVDSHYLEFQGTLWKFTWRYPYLNISDLQNWGKNNSHNLISQIYMKILWKRGEIALFSIIFFYLLLDFHVLAGTRFSLRDKRLFEISKVEITRVNCNFPSFPENSVLTFHQILSPNRKFAWNVKKKKKNFLGK